MNRHLDWNLIKVFLCVADEGSLSGAARRLKVSQPTVGRHIQEMERSFGNPLFDRHADGFSLTEHGAELIPFARQMAHAAGQTRLLCAKMEQEARDIIRITAPLWMSFHFLPKILQEFRAENPKTEVELVATDSAENLLFREADIALRTFQSTQLELITRKIGAMTLAPIAARAYLETHGQPQTPDEIFNYNLIGFDESTMIIHAMREFGWNPKSKDFGIRCDNQIIYWELIRAGHGIGFGSKAQAQKDPALEVLLPDLPMPEMPVWIAAHERIFSLPRIRKLWEHLVQGIDAALR